jgi:hypothetical protein
MIDGAYDLLGNINIHRSPWFNFTDQERRRGALQAIFEHFPLKTTCTLPPLPLVLTSKRKLDNDAKFALKNQCSRHRSLHRVGPRIGLDINTEDLSKSDFTHSGLDA